MFVLIGGKAAIVHQLLGRHGKLFTARDPPRRAGLFDVQ